jgi:hypothetical protein
LPEESGPLRPCERFYRQGESCCGKGEVFDTSLGETDGYEIEHGKKESFRREFKDKLWVGYQGEGLQRW